MSSGKLLSLSPSQFAEVTKPKIMLLLATVLCSVAHGTASKTMSVNEWTKQPKSLTPKERKLIMDQQAAARRGGIPKDPSVSNPAQSFLVNGGHAIHVGDRKYQEDRFIVNESITTKDGRTFKINAVFDGHGGERASEFAKHNFSQFLKEAFDSLKSESVATTLYDTVKKLDLIWNTFNTLRFKKNTNGSINKIYDEHGTTINVLLIEESTGRAWIANAGDSRCVTVKKPSNDPKKKSYASTIDHNVDSNPKERDRILKSGGRLDMGYCMWDTNPLGGWAITRHIGSRGLCIATVPDPDIYVQELKNVEYFVLATDGFWDAKITSKLCDQTFREMVNSSETPVSEQALAENLLKFCAERTMNKKVCPEFGGKLWDNVTIVVVSVKPKAPVQPVHKHTLLPSADPVVGTAVPTVCPTTVETPIVINFNLGDFRTRKLDGSVPQPGAKESPRPIKPTNEPKPFPGPLGSILGEIGVPSSRPVTTSGGR